MQIQSERLLLRPSNSQDWQGVYRGICDEEIIRNLASAPWPYERVHAQEFVQLPQFSDGEGLPRFLITLAQEPEGILGCIGLNIDIATGQVQLGYWIAREFWRRGFASEAACAVLEAAPALGHTRITASHFIDNPASGRVLEKAGFVATGEVRPGYSLGRDHQEEGGNGGNGGNGGKGGQGANGGQGGKAKVPGGFDPVACYEWVSETDLA